MVRTHRRGTRDRETSAPLGELFSRRKKSHPPLVYPLLVRIHQHARQCLNNTVVSFADGLHLFAQRLV